MSRCLSRSVVFALVSAFFVLTCCSESEARCRLFGRRQRICCPDPGQRACAPETRGLRCAIYYSGQIGNAHLHYGADYPGCASDFGPVTLAAAHCQSSPCQCTYDAARCISTSTLRRNDHEKDGIPHGTQKHEPSLEDNVVLDNGYVEFQGHGNPTLRLLIIKLPNTTLKGIAYQQDAERPAATSTEHIKLHGGKDHIGFVVYNKVHYDVLLWRP